MPLKTAPTYVSSHIDMASWGEGVKDKRSVLGGSWGGEEEDEEGEEGPLPSRNPPDPPPRRGGGVTAAPG